MAQQRKRANGEGSIFRLKDGSWRAACPGGRPSFRGHTSAEAIFRRESYLRTHRQFLALPRRARGSFAALLTRWLDSRREFLRPRTLEGYHDTVNRYIIPAIGEVLLAKLSADDIAEAMALGPSPRTKNYIRSVCHLALEYAVDNDILPRNIARRVSRIKPSRLNLEMPSTEESAALIAAIDSEGPCARALLLVIAFCGLRVGEACALRWSDYSRGEFRIRSTLDRENKLAPVKTDAGRRNVPVGKLVAAALAEWKIEQEAQKEKRPTFWRRASIPNLIFTTRNGSPWSQRNVLRSVHRVTTKSGMGRRSTHYLRHVAISYLIADPEVDIKTVQAIAGHSSIRVTLDTYGHLIPGRLQKAKESMDRRSG